jgi:hypothetical protein
MELKFKLEKPTKNTVRYHEEASAGRPPIINTIYIQKWFLGEAPPMYITLDIKEEK